MELNRNMVDNPQISVIIPVYGCISTVVELYQRLIKSLEIIQQSFEIIMVNDACPQNSWEVIAELAKKDQRLRGINLSRNFGQHKAILAGLDFSRGEWIVVMDCDLQDKPEEIIKLYSKVLEGYDAVFGRRYDRKDTLLKRTIARLFYWVYNYFTEGTFDYAICNFSICSRKVIDNYLKMREQNRAFPLFVKWMGFNQVAIDIEHSERDGSKSSYNLKKRWDLAKNIIITQSNKPLRFSVYLGVWVSFISFVYAAYLVIRYLFNDISVTGWTSLIVSIYFLSGLVLMNIGILGLYIGKIFDETKRRPIYIVKDFIN